MGARIALLTALIVGTLAGAVALHGIDPRVTSVFGGCRFWETTGYLCPGCGGTRAMHALLNFRVGEALSLNPLVFLVLGLFLLLANLIARELIGPAYPIPSINISSKVGWSLGALVLVFWIARNIPGWPFTLLGP